MLSKKVAAADRSRCVACGACLKVCPREAIQVVKGCYAMVRQEVCVGCGICEKTCPAGCMEVRMRGES